MKRTLLILLLIVGFCCAITIDETNNYWSTDQEHSGIVVPEGQTLTIAPGVTVTLTDEASHLRVEAGGRLIAVGTQEEPVVFNCSDTINSWGEYDTWSGILIDSGADTSTLSFVDIYDASFAIKVRGAHTIINNCNIFANELGSYGIDLYGGNTTPYYGATAEIRNCLIVSKSSTVTGIKVNVDCDAEIVNNTLVNCGIVVGGEYVSPRIINNIISDNAPLQILLNASPIIYNNIFTSTSAQVGSENYVTDPLFVDPDNGDFHLQQFSPAIDAGQLDSTFSNEQGINGLRVNLGAYGNTDQATETSIEITSLNGGETVHQGDTISLTWNSSRYSGDKRLEYSLDNGTSWDSISTIVTDTGSFDWIVPSVSSSESLVRISCKRDSRVTDQSNAVFTIDGSSPISATPPIQRASIQLLNNRLIFRNSVEYSVEVYSANGQILKEISGREATVSLNDLGLASGIYQMRVVQGADVFTGQFILK